LIWRPRDLPESSCGRVQLEEDVFVPPNSVVRIAARNTGNLDQFVLEPTSDILGRVLVPRTLHVKGVDPTVCLINPSDREVKLRRGQIIGVTTAAEVVPSVSVTPKDPPDSREAPVCIPTHLQDLFNRSEKHLTEPEKGVLEELLIEFQDVFAREELDLGDVTIIEHEIDTGDAKPVKQRLRRTPMGFAEEEENHLKKMLTAGVIQPSTSEWASAPVLIRKKCGGVRFAIDYRLLNSKTRRDLFPLPLIDECLDTLAGSEWFSKLDANSAYWQVRIKEEDRKKTAFVTKFGLFEHVRMGFGLCNAPATYARVMSLILSGLSWDIVLAFLDDAVVYGSSVPHHFQNLRMVLTRFRDYKLKLKPKKCELFQKQVEFLGRVVSRGGVAVKPESLMAVKGWPTPRKVKEVESFLGFANYHRGFIQDYAKMANPLYEVTGKKAFRWETAQADAFNNLKTALLNTPVMGLPNADDSFILDTDASDFAIGAELIQIQDGDERVISYGSFTMTPEQRKYCTTRKELLAVVRFTRQYRHYLLGKPFTVRTDHNSLRWLLSFKEPHGQLARWLEELSQYNMTVIHRPGSKHHNADGLSRIGEPAGECRNYQRGVPMEDLPCGGCHYCRKAQENWGQFERQLDYTIALSQRPRRVAAFRCSVDRAWKICI